MDSWSDIQLKKMELGGNERFNSFVSQYGIPKETDIVTKYNTKAASIYRDRIQALAEGRPWSDPPVVKETLKSNNNVRNTFNSKPPLSGGGSRSGNAGSNAGWDNWDSFDDGGYVGNHSSNSLRRNNTVSDFRSSGTGSGPSPSKSTEDMYSRAELEASAANKESFFARKMAENESRPEGLPPSQGGRYVGFGSNPPPVRRNHSEGDVLTVVTQGFGRLSMVAASAAQSAANVVQAGTKELTSKVKDGGYDYKVNETVNVVTAKTSEIGQRTWGIMKGVMALASQKVEEFTKEGSGWKNDSWQQKESDTNGYSQEFGPESRGWNSSAGAQSSSGRQFNSVSHSSWDDWDTKDSRKEETPKGTTSQDEDGWAGWDDAKDDDDGYDNSYDSKSDQKTKGYNEKSDANWTDGGFI